MFSFKTSCTCLYIYEFNFRHKFKLAMDIEEILRRARKYSETSSESEDSFYDDDEESVMNDRIDEEKIPETVTDEASASSHLTFRGVGPQFQMSIEERSKAHVPKKMQAKPGAFFHLLTDETKFEITEIRNGGKVETKPEFIHSFNDYHFDPRLIDNLKAIGPEGPTAVQKAYWHLALTKITHVMVQSQTGSGKTFAYLVPMIQRVITLKEMFARMQREGNKSFSKKKNAPLVIIFVPTKELISQVADYAKLLSQNIPEVSITTSMDRGPLTSDVHVTTIGGMMNFIETTRVSPYRRIELDGCLFTIFDEAYKFFHDRETAEKTKQVIEEIFEGKANMRISAFSATMAHDIENYMDGNYFSVADKNEVPATIDHKVIIVTPQEAKTEVLSLLNRIKKESGGVCPKVLIFANRRVLCDILAFHLTAHGYLAMSSSANWPQQVREKSMRDFKEGVLDVLVASDVLAPGVDWNVDVVINYQLPPKDQFHRFTHRMGRTGRAGNTGKVFSFFYNGYGIKDQIDPDDFVSILKELNFEVPDYLQAYYDLYGDREKGEVGVEMGYDEYDLELEEIYD
ncbi:hypothetical protein L596_027688 [Steinernema carpocapsae]|uniref:ATP-dependent RNA helicase n=1 Tax=Steinernema carpocapsae TaxID=34508 RepID=A0A4U5LW80_STECR|nr:hypothetical protein L596_027688 [Steinernema carpocapsae]